MDFEQRGRVKKKREGDGLKREREKERKREKESNSPGSSINPAETLRVLLVPLGLCEGTFL